MMIREQLAQLQRTMTSSSCASSSLAPAAARAAKKAPMRIHGALLLALLFARPAHAFNWENTPVSNNIEDRRQQPYTSDTAKLKAIGDRIVKLPTSAWKNSKENDNAFSADELSLFSRFLQAYRAKAFADGIARVNSLDTALQGEPVTFKADICSGAYDSLLSWLAAIRSHVQGIEDDMDRGIGPTANAAEDITQSLGSPPETCSKTCASYRAKLYQAFDKYDQAYVKLHNRVDQDVYRMRVENDKVADEQKTANCASASVLPGKHL